MSYRITGFIIALIIVGGVVAGLSLWMAELHNHYPGAEYDNTTLDVYNQLEDLTNQTEEIRDKSVDTGDKTGLTDILGGFFQDAYRVLKITVKSFTTFGKMNDAAMEDANLGDIGGYLKIMILSIVIIAIFIGVIVSIIVKRPDI